MAGKHRAPSQFVPRLIKIGTTSLAASTIPLVSVGSAEAAGLDSSVLEIIAQCESGNRNVPHNSALSGVHSTASGYLQILDSTWKAFGGREFASRAIHASREEQFIVGTRILAGQGISAWNPSKSCWGSKVDSNTPKKVPEEIKAPTKAPAKAPAKASTKTVKKVPVSVPKTVKSTKPTPKKVAPPTRTAAERVAASYLIKRGDTLSEIAQRKGMTTKKLYNLNRDTVKNPDLIYAGNHLRVR
jgi:nucleoid-associated protein YgaU